MFNLKGSEVVFLLLIALVVLGPEKLPDAIRRFGSAYAQFRRMASGFQGELRSALDEPLRELRGTADAVRQAARLDDAPSASAPSAPERAPDRTPAPRPDSALNFGAANPRRAERVARRNDPSSEPTDANDGDMDPSEVDESPDAGDDERNDRDATT